MQFKPAQASGTGLTLVSALAPTLGIEVPYWARLVGVAIGMVMLIWPVVVWAFDSIRGDAESKLRFLFFAGCAITALTVWYIVGVPVDVLMLIASKPAKLAVSTPAPPAPARKIDATWGKAYYKCKAKDVEPTKEDANDFKAYIEAWANAYSYKSPIVSSVPGGLKAEVTPLTVNTEPSKRTFQIVKIGKELFGIYSADYSYAIYSSASLVPNSPAENQIRKVIEGLAKVAAGDCELQ